MSKIFKKIFNYCPVPAFMMYVLALISIVLHVSFYASAEFADFFNQTFGAFVRGILAAITNWLPFSLAETVLVSVPIVLVVLLIYVFKIPSEDVRMMRRYTFAVVSVICYIYSVFVIGFASSYRGESLTVKLELDQVSVTPAELDFTAREIYSEIEELLPEVTFKYASSSVMPYSFDEMNGKLNEAYSSAAEKYGFITNFKSNLKYVTLSKAMTYTHISGVYTFFTGESNINVNFPDYTIPFTAAHEMSHQRGIGPENEANFMAFLVCLESDDPYIKYSGYLNVFEYVLNALYQADTNLYSSLLNEIDYRVRYEMIAYSEFFKEYRDTVASEITGTINDTYLQSQGQTAGSKSYGMVVDLAVAYYKKSEKAQ